MTTEVKYDKNNYPDPRSWNAEEVADFFRQAGFTDHAQVFLDKVGCFECELRTLVGKVSFGLKLRGSLVGD